MILPCATCGKKSSGASKNCRAASNSDFPRPGESMRVMPTRPSSNAAREVRQDLGGEPLDPAADLVRRVTCGDRAALADLFSLYRPRLWRMVNFRLQPQL